MKVTKEEVFSKIKAFNASVLKARHIARDAAEHKEQVSPLEDANIIQALLDGIGGVGTLFSMVLESRGSPDVSLIGMVTGLFQSEAAFPFLSTPEALTYLATGITFPNQPAVREFVLRQLVHWVKDVGLETTAPALLQIPIFPSLLTAVSDEEVDVAEKAQSIVVCLCGLKDGVDTLFKDSSLALLCPPNSDGGRISTTALRVHALCARAASASPYACEVYKGGKFKGLMGLLSKELAEEDPLTLLNAFEICKTLLATSHTFNALVEEAVLERLLILCPQTTEVDFLQEHLICGVLDFAFHFAEKARVHKWTGWSALSCAKENTQTCIGFINFLQNQFKVDNMMVQVAAGNAICAIAGSAEGLVFVGHPLPSQCNGKVTPGALFLVACSLAQDNDPDVRAKALNALATVLAGQYREQSPVCVKASEAQHELFASLRGAKRPLEFLGHNARLPFTDVALAALRTLAAVATHGWGVDAIAGDDACFSFLMDKNLATNEPECRTLKAEIVANIRDNPSFKVGGRVTEHMVLQVAGYANGERGGGAGDREARVVVKSQSAA